jgi:hypothetical protein
MDWRTFSPPITAETQVFPGLGRTKAPATATEFERRKRWPEKFEGLERFSGVGAFFGRHPGYPFEEDWRPLSRIPVSSMRAPPARARMGYKGECATPDARQARHMRDWMRDTVRGTDGGVAARPVIVVYDTIICHRIRSPQVSHRMASSGLPHTWIEQAGHAYLALFFRTVSGPLVSRSW